MPKKCNKEYSLITLYETFIEDCLKLKRVQANGKPLSAGTIANYGYTLKLLKGFCLKKDITLRIRTIQKLNTRELEREKNYWKKFYNYFSDYLYTTCKCFDNYVGQCFKNIKVFFGYLNKEKAIITGDFYKSFYVRKEEVAIYPLLPEELNFLIYDQRFEQSLSKRMREVKDFFVFGCTVALRFSDLNTLKKNNVRIVNQHHYLAVRSIKTSTDTLVKLPSYAVEIMERYKKEAKRLLPQFNSSNLNIYIKELLALAGFTQGVLKTRERRGKGITINKSNGSSIVPLRFCDVASTHTMRRTAITTMLSLGVSEQIVRRVSGHAPHSKEFFRYVLWAQTYQDQETENMFEILKQKSLLRVL